MSTLIFPSLGDLLENRGIPFSATRPEDGYDFGVRWRGPGTLVHRLTWLGPRGRTEKSAAPGELYLLGLGFGNGGSAELLCVIPPVEGDPVANVREILKGWEDVCGEPNSTDWIRDRVSEALQAGWATKPHQPRPAAGASLMDADAHAEAHKFRGETHEMEERLQDLLGPKTDEERRKRVLAVIAENVSLKTRLAALADLFKPEPYTGLNGKIVCLSCNGRGEVNGRNADDPRWVPCSVCGGDGLSEAARAALRA